VLDANWRQARVAAGGGRAAWEKAWGLVARLPGCAARCSTWGDVLFPRTPADERIAQTGVFFWEAEGLPLPRRVVLATAPIPSTGSCACFLVVVVVYGLWGAATFSPPPTSSWPTVWRVSDSGSGGENKNSDLAASACWEPLQPGGLAGRRGRGSVGPRSLPRTSPGWHLRIRRTKRNRLLYGRLGSFS
jgi:hypothetical protein